MMTVHKGRFESEVRKLNRSLKTCNMKVDIEQENELAKELVEELSENGMRAENAI